MKRSHRPDLEDKVCTRGVFRLMSYSEHDAREIVIFFVASTIVNPILVCAAAAAMHAVISNTVFNQYLLYDAPHEDIRTVRVYYRGRQFGQVL